MYTTANNKARCHRGCQSGHKRKVFPTLKNEKQEVEGKRQCPKRVEVNTHSGRKKAIKIVKDLILKDLYSATPISEAPNCKFSKDEIFSSLFGAIASRRYVTPYCTAARMNRARHPDGDTVFYRLKPETFGNVEGIIEWANERLLYLVKIGYNHGLFDGQLMIAEDQTEEGVFGRPDPSAVGTVKIKGAKYSHRLMIAQAVAKEKNRLPLRIAKSGPLQTPNKVCVEVLDRIIQIHPNLWFLADREFFTTEVIGALLKYILPWVIPAVRNEKVAALIPMIKRLAQPVIPGRSERVYIIPDFQLGEGEKAVHFPLVAIYRPDEPVVERQLFLFSTHGPVSPQEALLRADYYENRWGIETGNRDQDKLQGLTRSPCPKVQWFMQVVGVVLYALWWMCNVFLSNGPPPERYPLNIDLFLDILRGCYRWSFSVS